MDKKGQVLEVSVAVGVIVITLFSVYSVANKTDDIYFGDSMTKIYYEYPNCSNKIESIPKANVVVFQTEEQAINSGYTKHECK